ncbi:protein TRACHEARY ELEMENT DIFFERENTIATION-RELATED 7A-like [Malania oleifera]|uniref:protein TRACHEARY ELEMENT DIFFERENTIATION-RELATED 7A-like n=1 Tax=Malania oleifera TaxID=397392 RepID=UPI0025AE06AD|nr:protein TRACHEARY ELEMENT DIFFERENTIATION-RELATED 7A-like [Malania oleifera]
MVTPPTHAIPILCRMVEDSTLPRNFNKPSTSSAPPPIPPHAATPPPPIPTPYAPPAAPVLVPQAPATRMPPPTPASPDSPAVSSSVFKEEEIASRSDEGTPSNAFGDLGGSYSDYDVDGSTKED